jgi:hypothetical protein
MQSTLNVTEYKGGCPFVRLAAAVLRAAPAYREYDFLPGLGFNIWQATHPFTFTPTIADFLEEALAPVRDVYRWDGGSGYCTSRCGAEEDVSDWIFHDGLRSLTTFGMR